MYIKNKMLDAVLGIANFRSILYQILELHTADCYYWILRSKDSMQYLMLGKNGGVGEKF